jgi:hypothetical protein
MQRIIFLFKFIEFDFIDYPYQIQILLINSISILILIYFNKDVILLEKMERNLFLKLWRNLQI